MKRASSTKFPNAVQLFKFCQKVLMHQRGQKVRDQEVGSILEFNPSDCSHWKRGEKNVRSVFALAKLAEVMQIEAALVHDVASGAANLDEAFFEYVEARTFKNAIESTKSLDPAQVELVRTRVLAFVSSLHKQSEFSTPPLYLPEVFQNFAFVSTQPIDIIDKLSRILRVKAGHYCIQYRKGDLKAQTRLSMVKDLSRIVFEGERARFPELGASDSTLLAYEEMLFATNLLLPKAMIQAELTKLDTRKNVVAELATLFWVPKSLICLQLQDSVRNVQHTVPVASDATRPAAPVSVAL
jgi:hypothetical protein